MSVLSNELKNPIFELVFPEGRTVVQLTAFCALNTDQIDVVRLASDDHMSTAGTLANLTNFSLNKPLAIHGILSTIATAAFWKNAKIVINIQDEPFRTPLQESYRPANGFLDQSAGRISHLTLKLWLYHGVDTQGLARRLTFDPQWTSCVQTIEMKAFGRGVQTRYCKLSVGVEEHLDGFLLVATMPDADARRD